MAAPGESRLDRAHSRRSRAASAPGQWRRASRQRLRGRLTLRGDQTLAFVINDDVERSAISESLGRNRGNISENRSRASDLDQARALL